MTTTVDKGPVFGMRHLQAVLIFFNIVVIYFSRLNVSVSVVAMTNANTTNPNFPEYDWNEKHKSYILSSFYWGYAITQLPGGYLSRRYGSKLIILLTTFSTAICSLLTPVLIPWGSWQIYCVIRVIMGLAQGVLFPAIHHHLGMWSPASERTFLGGFSHSGIECGFVVAMGVTGLIAASSLGWPGVSYVSAGASFTWCLLWLIFGYNNATTARFITPEECKYIESDLKRSDNFHNKKIPIPWLAICTSRPFLSMLVVFCAMAWGVIALQTEMPSYLAGVMHMNIKSNTLFSSLPYVAMWMLAYVYIFAADFVLDKQLATLTVVRKTASTIALWIPAAMLIGIGFLNEEQTTLALVLMILNVGINGGTTIGVSLNTIDLSPNHAGVLMGIANTLGNCVAMVTPLLVGVIVTDEHDRTLWQTVFIISGATFFFGNLVFIFFGSAETQPWDAPDFLTRDNVEDAKLELSGTELCGKSKTLVVADDIGTSHAKEDDLKMPKMPTETENDTTKLERRK